MSNSSQSDLSSELSKLRWRCRRGMLENDLIITRYLDENEHKLGAEEINALYVLMELSDNELWDILSGCRECTEPALKPLVDVLRATRLSSS